MKLKAPFSAEKPKGFLSRLAKDPSGNTLALMAAGILPLLAMVGGAVDMSRAYLANSRLQQACDSGVLAARKYLGSSVIVDNKVPADVSTIGNRFFNLNYRNGEYGTDGRNFQMFLETDFSVSGDASVQVPTVIMNMFGVSNIPVEVTCAAQLSTPSVDVMMALDVTGSMRIINAGDTLSRIETLKETIRGFHAKLEGGKAPNTEIRYGFVPYNANVNVGALLDDKWVVDEWTYQSREDAPDDVQVLPGSSSINRVEISGDDGDWYEVDRYVPTATGFDGTPECNPQPAETYNLTSTVISTVTEPFAGPPAGTQTTTTIEYVENGIRYQDKFVGGECILERRDYANYTYRLDNWTRPYDFTWARYNYRPILTDVKNWRTESDMCIEERSTYDITDYDAVDLTQALDLNLDLVPSPADSDTQWRPRYPNLIYGRARNHAGTGDFTTDEVLNTRDNYVNPGFWWQSDCPPAAQKLQEMDATQLDAYLATLEPEGSTYHDIGMIWGGRLLSPTGLFAGENEDKGDIVRSRNLIWMTDGQTEPYDFVYGAYGFEPIDQRRWDPATSTFNLTETVEKRFAFACDEVKRLNITVWVIAFGTTVTPIMEECAGDGRYFQAANADQLNDAFTSIADSLGDLRITQ